MIRLVGADGEHQVEHGALLAEVPVGPPDGRRDLRKNFNV